MVKSSRSIHLFTRNRYFFIVDLVLITMAVVFSFYMRLDASSLRPYSETMAAVAIIAVLLKPGVFFLFGLYRRYWRYASVDDLVMIVYAVSTASVVTAVTSFLVIPYVFQLPPIPRSIPVMDWLVTLALVGGARFSVRVLTQSAGAYGARSTEMKRVLVVGAGDAGAMIVKEMLSKPYQGLLPVGFVDDAPVKQRVRIHNVPVLGTREDLPALVLGHRIDQVVIAMPTAPGKVIREVVAMCEQARVPSQIIPGVYEIISGQVRVSQLRKVQIEDLLQREPIKTDMVEVSAYVRGTCVLVTGAGGSIGSELCRQLARYGPARLVLLGHGEYSIFNIERELRRRFPALSLESVIADIRDAERMDQIMARYRPATIFHAAAHKHVPLMECNVEEAFTNNVLGTQAVLRAAERNGVERFVMISTDKAVNPTSVMGATKRVAEKLVRETALRAGKPYVAVRFGNVLGSRGSVVPIFQEQIAAGGPVTVTHPDMRRYFMTIPEAVQLVLQAASLGRGGEIFMLDMGEPVKIVDMVKDLIELSGLKPGEDIEIAYTGVRPGEKLYEELLMDGEEYGPTAHAKIFLSRNGRTPAADAPECSLAGQVAETAELARRMETAAVVRQLRRLVPEFRANHVGGVLETE